MDLIELRARIRAMSPTPEAFAARAGLPAGLIRGVMRGDVRPSSLLVDHLRRTLIPPEPEGEQP